MVDALERLLSAAERAAVNAPIEEAMTLPAQAFTSPEFFRLEAERIFMRNWIALCFAAWVPEPGDVKPIEVFEIPLLVVRGDDGEVRVFHNICPYDGCLVAIGPGRGLDEIEAPYHGWRYDLRGQLRAAPYWGGSEDEDPAALDGRDGDLIEVRSACRLGTVYIHLGEEAPGIDEYLEPLTRLLADRRLDELTPSIDASGATIIEERTIRCNWKTYMENAAINVLHESFTHESYRRSPEVPRVRNGKKTFEVHIDGPLMAFSYSMMDVRKTYDPMRIPHLGSDPKRAPERGFFTTLYPNTVAPVTPYFLKVNIVHPLSPGETRLQHLSFFAPEALDHPDYAATEEKRRLSYHKVYREDQIVIEAVQRARRSPVWRQHYYAPFWDEQHYHLNRLVLADLERTGASAQYPPS